MRQLTITVTESEYPFIRQLLKRQRGVAIAKAERLPAPPAKTPEQVYARLNPEQREWVDELKNALNDVERHQRGEIEMMTAEDHLAELRAIRDQKWPISK